MCFQKPKTARTIRIYQVHQSFDLIFNLRTYLGRKRATIILDSDKSVTPSYQNLRRLKLENNYYKITDSCYIQVIKIFFKLS